MSSFPQEGVARETPVNWSVILKSIVDGYEGTTSIAHGVQKDGIQNGWDARISDKGDGWSFKFELIEGSANTYLTMTDAGTTGLTGKVIRKEEYLSGLPKEERWAAFEGYGYTKEDIKKKRALGSRGRGKFIFVGSSSKNHLLYDTLTIDGNYRFGARKIDETGNPVIHYEEDRGRKKILEVTHGALTPQERVGTRVIIVDPIPEIIEATRSGALEFMIGETWWEIIGKYNARIVIAYDGVEHVVKIPPEFDLPKKDAGTKKVWLKHGIKKQFGNVNTEVRTLHIVCDPGVKVHEDLLGISIQRDKMKICSEQHMSLPPHIRESMYGYICLNDRGEAAIKDAEGVEHSSLKGRQAFPKELRRWLVHEMTEFAKKKLGYSPHPEKERREKQKSAERRALSAINRIAKALNLARIGPAAREHLVSTRGLQKSIRIQLSPPDFPNPQSSRVDYGQHIRNIGATVINDSEDEIRIRLKIFVRYGSESVIDLAESEHSVANNGREVCYGPTDLLVRTTQYPKKGPYMLTARITDAQTADRLDQKSFTFYVETEPMAKGIFEAYKPFGLDEGEYQYSIGFLDTSSSGGFLLNYNVLHPGYLAVEEDTDTTTEYLFRFAAMELTKIDLGSDEPKIVDVDLARLNNPDYLLERHSLVMGKLFYYFHKGAP